MKTTKYPKGKIPPRFPDCEKYTVCLNAAAKSNSAFSCVSCREYLQHQEAAPESHAETEPYLMLAFALKYPDKWRTYCQGKNRYGIPGISPEAKKIRSEKTDRIASELKTNGFKSVSDFARQINRSPSTVRNVISGTHMSRNIRELIALHTKTESSVLWGIQN